MKYALGRVNFQKNLGTPSRSLGTGPKKFPEKFQTRTLMFPPSQIVISEMAPMYCYYIRNRNLGWRKHQGKGLKLHWEVFWTISERSRGGAQNFLKIDPP